MSQTKLEEDLKNRVEAILFSAGKKISLEDISKLSRSFNQELVEKILCELQQEYEARNSPLMIVNEGDSWKLSVRERYLPYIKKIVAETELPKSVMETLAIIAWKSPALQSEIVEIRSNKAYDHIYDLEQAGFILKEKHGRTYILKLTQKFFDYFDLKDEEEIKKRFERYKEKVFKKMPVTETLSGEEKTSSKSLPGD